MYNPRSARLINGKYRPLRATHSISKTIMQAQTHTTRKDTILNEAVPNLQNATRLTQDKVNTLFNNIIHRPKFPIIVTAYTIDSHLGNYYQRCVTRLTKSCIKFNLQHIVFPLNSVDSWLHGCNLKPTVILHALQLFQSPILWIDADAEIFKYPQIFEDPFKYDIALAAEAPPSGHWLSGTLYCKPAAIDFVEAWRQHTPTKSIKDKDADEVTIRNLWYDSDPASRPSIHLLPEPYNTIIHTKTNLSNVVIGHYIREDIAPVRNCEALPVPEL